MARIANSSRTVRELYAQEWGVWEYKEWTNSTGQYNTFGNATASVFQWWDTGENATTIYKLMENGKSSLLYSTSGYTAPTLTYFKNPHFFGGPVATLGTDSSGNTVYLCALVCLYEVDYEKYDLDHKLQ
jgi:hypothetical protein